MVHYSINDPLLSLKVLLMFIFVILDHISFVFLMQCSVNVNKEFYSNEMRTKIGVVEDARLRHTLVLDLL